jgi:putative pyruvate formate lyase activating enzyme
MGMVCDICPRKCNIDRSKARGFCAMGETPVAARAFLHMWEEPCISGKRGSGAVFFSGCNLKCIYCQNYEISHYGRGREVTVRELADIFLTLRDKGAHNINLVTPTHFVPAIIEALGMAKNPCANDRPPLDIPVVYNTNAYDSIKQLNMLEKMIDIYLPDLKYISPELSKRYSGAPDYFEKASAAILEMYRQKGAPEFDAEGMMRKGVIIRHLVLPGHTAETMKILEWISANLSKDAYVSLMSQYTPCHLAREHERIGRRITRHEYDRVVSKFIKLGLNGFVQERESASEEFIPDFDEVSLL